LANHDVECECGATGILNIKATDEWREDCPICLKKQSVRRVFKKAPHLGMDEDTEVAALQQSCRDHFYKKGIDEVRHKHGAVADDAIRQADIDRIKNARMG